MTDQREKSYINTIAGALLIFQFAIIVVLLFDGRRSDAEVRKLLKESRLELKVMNKLVESAPSQKNYILSEESVFAIFTKSYKAKYCTIVNREALVIVFSMPNVVKLWKTDKKPFKVDTMKVPLLFGEMLKYGNSVIVKVNNHKWSKREIEQLHSIHVDSDGVVTQFRLGQVWYSQEKCKRVTLT